MLSQIQPLGDNLFLGGDYASRCIRNCECLLRWLGQRPRYCSFCRIAGMLEAGRCAKRPVYAVVLSDVKLGAFQSQTTAEQIFISRYGRPASTSHEGQPGMLPQFFGGASTYLAWDTQGQITKDKTNGLIRLSVEDPQSFDRLFPAFLNTPILVVEIQQRLVNGTWFYYAHVVSVDMQAAQNLVVVSQESVRAQRAAAQRREFEQAPKPRF